MSTKSRGFVYAGEVRPDGELIKVAAAIGDARGRSVPCDEQGIYLLEHGQQFSLRLSNYNYYRQVSMDITGDDDSTVIAQCLILDARQTNSILKRWLTLDQAFMAYRRDSEEGFAVGGDLVPAGGGGLIKIVFTIGRREEPEFKTMIRGAVQPLPRTRALRDRALEAYNGPTASRVEEGVMGAGKATRQRFRKVTFAADPDIPQFEIQLRWGIEEAAIHAPPPDRRVTTAPLVV